jgi:hypothetical protein
LFKFVLWQRFREKVAYYIPFSFDMSDEKSPFLDSVAQPEKTDIHAFRSFSVDGVCCQPFGRRVIHQDRRGSLGVTEFRECVAELGAFLCILERCP